MKPASLWRRFAAMVYDLFLLVALLFAATAILLPFTGGQAISTGNYLYTFYLFTVCFYFYGWCWTRSGQTLGMKAWKLKVVTTDNQLLGWSQSIRRFLVAVFSLLVAGLGYWWCLIDPEQRSWHDRLSNSKTIHYS